MSLCASFVSPHPPLPALPHLPQQADLPDSLLDAVSSPAVWTLLRQTYLDRQQRRQQSLQLSQQQRDKDDLLERWGLQRLAFMEVGVGLQGVALSVSQPLQAAVAQHK